MTFWSLRNIKYYKFIFRTESQSKTFVLIIMSKFERVKQWAAFSRNWHIYDAKWQNPFTSAKAITKVL